MGDTAGSQSTMVQLEDFEVVFAQSLGIDPEERHALVLMYFAKELLYIVPDGWEVLINKDSSVKLPYFFDPANDESHWIHPYEEHYRDLIEGNRAQLLANDPPTPSSAGRSSRSSFSPRSSNASPRSSISSGSPRNPFSATEEQKDSNSPLPPIGGGAGGAGGGAAAAAEQAGLDAKLHEVERQFARSLSVRSNEEFESELYDYANELLQTLPEGWEFAIAESDDALFPLFVRLEDEETQLEHPLQADHKQTLQELRYVLTYGVLPESAEQAAALTSPVAPSTAEPGADNKTSEEEKVSAKSRTDTDTRATATAKLPSLRPTSASARSIANASVNDMSSKPLPLMRAHSARLIRSGKLDPVSGKERPMSAKAVEMVDEWIGAAVNTVRQSARPATADSQPRSHAVEDDTAVEPIFDLKSRSFSIKLLRQNEPDADKPVLHYLESENLGGYEDLSPSEAVDGPPLSSKAAAALGKPAIPLSTVGEEASVGSGSLHSASVKAAAGGGGGKEEGGGEKGEGGGSLEGEDQRSLQARRSSLSSRERLDELRSDKHKNTIAHTMSILEPSLSDDDLTLNSGRRQRSSKALGGGDEDGDEGDDTETVHTANTISTHPHADTEAVAGPGEGDGGESFGMDKATLEALGIDAAKVEQELADLALTPKGPSPTAATAEAAATAAASAEAEAEAAENAESTVGAKGSDSDGPVEHIPDELSLTIQKPSEDALAASSPKQATPPEEKKTPANEFVFNKIELKPQLMILQFGSIGNDDDDGVDYDAMDDGDDDDTHGNVSLEKFSAMVTDPVPSPPPEPETASPEESATGRSGSSSSSPHKKMEGGQGQEQEQEKDEEEEEEEDDVKLSPPEASPVPPPTIEAYPQPGADSAPRDDDGDGDNNGTAADLEPRELDPESAEWAQRQLQEYMQRKPHTAASTTSSGGDDNASSGQRSPRRYASAGTSGAHSSSRGGGAPTSAQRRTTTTVGTRGRTGVLRGNRDAPDSPSFVLNIAQGNSIHVNTKFLDALRAKRKEQPAASARRSPVKVVKVSKKPPNTIGGDDPEQQSGPAGGSDEALLANWSHDSAEGNKTAELGPLKRTSSKRSPLKCVRFGPSGNDVLNANKWYLVGCYRHYKQAVHARNLVEGMVMTDSQGTILIDPRLVFLDEEAGANDEGGDGGSPDAQNNVNANDMTFSMSMAKNSGFYSPSQTQSIIQDPNSISGKWSSCREPQPADASSTVYGATIGSSNTMGATSRATRMPKENDTAELIMGRVKRTTESLVKLRVRKDMCRMQWVVETDEKEVWKIAHRHKKKKGVDLEGGPGNLAVAQLKMSHKAKSLGKASEGGTDEDELVGEKLPPIHNPAAVKAAFAATKAFGAIAKMKISDGEAGRKRIPMITKKERKSSALNRSSKDRSSNNRVEALDSTVGRRSGSAGGPHNNGPLMLPDIQQRRGLSSV